jgi:hypothetical protein
MIIYDFENTINVITRHNEPKLSANEAQIHAEKFCGKPVQWIESFKITDIFGVPLEPKETAVKHKFEVN